MRHILLFCIIALSLARTADAADNPEHLMIVNAGKVGLITLDGTIVAEPQHYGLFWYQTEDYPLEFPLIPITNRELAFDPEQLDELPPAVKFGYANHAGAVVVPVALDAAMPFREGLAAASLGGKWGFMGPDGNWAIQPQYEDATDFHGGFAAVADERGYFHINNQGEAVHGQRFAYAEQWFDGRAVVVDENERMGWIDQKGMSVIALAFDWASPFDRGVATAEFAGKSGIIDKDGEWLVPPKWDEVGYFWDDHAPARDGEQWGLINSDGTWVIPSKYQSLGSYSGGYVAAMQDDVWGLLDATGAIQLPFAYEWIGASTHGIIPVFNNGKCWYLKADGSEVSAPQAANSPAFEP